MKRLAYGMVVLLMMSVSGIAWADDKTNDAPQRLRLELDLDDGSHVVGIPGIESIPVQTTFAKMDITLKQITTIRIEEDHENASFDLLNGDKLKGVIKLEPIKLDTAFGVVKIGIEHIRTINVVSGGGHGGNRGELKQTVPGNSVVDGGKVTKGQRYWFEASGLVGVNIGGPNGGPATKADPDGRTISQTDGTATAPHPADGRFPCPGLATHSLVGMIGVTPTSRVKSGEEGTDDRANSGTVQLGSKGSFVAPATGRLTLLCNDDIPDDNSGSWDVRISW